MESASSFAEKQKNVIATMKKIRSTRKNIFINSLTASSKITFVLFFLFYLISCHHFQQKIKLVDSTSSIAFFEVEEGDWKELFPQSILQSEPSMEHLGDLPKILSSIQYKRGVLAYEDWDQLVPDSYVTEIDKFVQKIKNQPENKVYLCSYRIDDLLSPNVKILKTSFYILGTKHGLVILFQEINTNISFPTQYAFEDWIIIKPTKIKPIYKPELWIKNKDSISLYKEKNESKTLVYGNVIVYKDFNLLPNPPLYRYPKEEDDSPKDLDQWKTVPEKLKVLEEMRKNKLITDEEYQKKKTELLKEF